ncbi:MAG TPA: helix-turn-helix domain-containing protein [Mycobacteriales bacterium]|nr:helix-turn-helix domain-containing protein [Mycobacteriales bacterium]
MADKSGIPAGLDARWRQLPSSLGPLLAGVLDELAADVMTAVRSEIPLYDRPMEGSFGRGIQLGVHEALSQFCRLVETQGAAEIGAMAVYEELGRGEWRHGRPLETLLAAYRVGARVAWRRFALVAADADLGTTELVALAELVFAHIDTLSAASADGYAEEQSAQAGERDRQRMALLRVLLSPAVDLESAAAAARAASWPLPRSLRVVLAPGGTRLSTLLGPSTLVVDTDPALALVGDPPPQQRLSAVLAGSGAVIGPLRGIDGAAGSRDRARAVLTLRQEGRVPAPPDAPVCTEDYLVDLMLWADQAVATDLADRVLAPLERLPAGTRDRLIQTLRAWLQYAGERAAAATALHVHPQTVRYRMSQLRELLGDVVDDPQARLELLLAVEWRVRQGG